MNIRFVRSALVLVFALCWTAVATAQMPPGDPKFGNKLGVQELNNSGEDGEVTLFGKNGGRQTLVVVILEGAPHARPQPVSIRHSNDCERISAASPIELHPLSNGHSSTLIDVPIMKLLSGNYSVVVSTRVADPNHYVSCGHLYL